MALAVWKEFLLWSPDAGYVCYPLGTARPYKALLPVPSNLVYNVAFCWRYSHGYPPVHSELFPRARSHYPKSLDLRHTFTTLTRGLIVEIRFQRSLEYRD